MFIRFTPLSEYSGVPLGDESVIVNTENVVTMTPNRSEQGWKANGLSIKFTNGDEVPVYVAPLNATAEELDDRMIALSIALRDDETTNITTPFFKPGDDLWMPGDTV